MAHSSRSPAFRFLTMQSLLTPLPPRCASDDIPFFRILLAFRSMLTINRHCSPAKILALLRWHFSLTNHSLPIVLHEIVTGREIILSDETSFSVAIDHGIYLALVQHHSMKYQPLLDVTLVPVELFPEKIFLPLTIPFILYRIRPFSKRLINLIDYMVDDEKTRRRCRLRPKQASSSLEKESIASSPFRSISHASTTKRIYRGKSTIAQISSPAVSPELVHTPISILLGSPSLDHQTVDISKYVVTDPQRIYRTREDAQSLPFAFRILHPMVQSAATVHPQMFSGLSRHSSAVDEMDTSPGQFDDNDLILFKQRLVSAELDPPTLLELVNCIHQLSVENKLGKPLILDLLRRIDQQLQQHELHQREIGRIIDQLREAASQRQEETSTCRVSTLIKKLLRIDQLAKYQKLEQEKVNTFNGRLVHLARLGVFSHPTKLYKKLLQLDLCNNEHQYRTTFAHFVDEDVQRFLPRHIPLNALGIREVLHQLRLNIDRLGPVLTLMLIDNLQQLVHSGVLLTMHQTPNLKAQLRQLTEHIQSTRCNGVYLQRLIEQINASLHLTSMKKVLLTNQMNTLLQRMKVKASNEKIDVTIADGRDISPLMALASQGRLVTYLHMISNGQRSDPPTNEEQIASFLAANKCTNDEPDSLQSLLVFLHEQSTSAPSSGSVTPRQVCDFIQHLRHFAQLGLLCQPAIFHVLTELHRAKDRDHLTSEQFTHTCEHLQAISYLKAYDHLNLMHLDHFLHSLVVHDDLTWGQACYILDSVVHLCRLEPVTPHDLETFLTHIQSEHARQQMTYVALIKSLQSFAESYSSSLAELHSFERELTHVLTVANSSVRRMPEEVRRRLHELMTLCRTLTHDRRALKELFGSTMNFKFYNHMKEMLKTRNFINRRQSLTAIIQMYKHFLHTSQTYGQTTLVDQQLNHILQMFLEQCPKDHHRVETALKRMAELGHLQDKRLVDYLQKNCLSDLPASWTSERCADVRGKLQNWPLTCDLNHTDVRHVIDHLTHLEMENQLDTGTCLELQNRLNQLARFGQCVRPQIKRIIDGILACHGKKRLTDRDGFQRIQSYCLILHDVTRAIELEWHIQQLASKHQLSTCSNARFRQFLYQILENPVSIDELTRYRAELNRFLHVKNTDISHVNRFIDLLPPDTSFAFPLTLTDQVFARLRWDGKTLDPALRDQLLKLERSGILSRDTFEDVYNKIYRSPSNSFPPVDSDNRNQLLSDLVDQINDLFDDGQIDLQKSIEVKEQLYFLEEIEDLTDWSTLITIESRLLNSSTLVEFNRMTDELYEYVRGEQFRLSKAMDLIQAWQWNEETGNALEKQVMKLLDELALLNRLYDRSSSLLFDRYIGLKQMNSTVQRQLLRDLQRQKNQASIDRQAVDCIRSLEAALGKLDTGRCLTESLIKRLENRLKLIFRALSRPSEQHVRSEVVKHLQETLETYVKSNTEGSAVSKQRSDELLQHFDLQNAAHSG